jgi:hypothetical protein
MIRKFKCLPFPVIVLCGLAWAACTQQRAICLTPTTASFNMVFMHLPADTSTIFIDTALPAAVFVALTKKGTDTTVYSLQQSAFTISLSPDSDFCRYLFKTDTTTPYFDTLTFYYQHTLQFLSNACGFAYFYTLDSVRTTHFSNGPPPYFSIDSTYIINTSVTNNVNTTQLQVYIHPDWF